MNFKIKIIYIFLLQREFKKFSLIIKIDFLKSEEVYKNRGQMSKIIKKESIKVISIPENTPNWFPSAFLYKIQEFDKRSI